MLVRSGRSGPEPTAGASPRRRGASARLTDFGSIVPLSGHEAWSAERPRPPGEGGYAGPGAAGRIPVPRQVVAQSRRAAQPALGGTTIEWRWVPSFPARGSSAPGGGCSALVLVALALAVGGFLVVQMARGGVVRSVLDVAVRPEILRWLGVAVMVGAVLWIGSIVLTAQQSWPGSRGRRGSQVAFAVDGVSPRRRTVGPRRALPRRPGLPHRRGVRAGGCRRVERPGARGCRCRRPVGRRGPREPPPHRLRRRQGPGGNPDRLPHGRQHQHQDRRHPARGRPPQPRARSDPRRQPAVVAVAERLRLRRRVPDERHLDPRRGPAGPVPRRREPWAPVHGRRGRCRHRAGDRPLRRHQPPRLPRPRRRDGRRGGQRPGAGVRRLLAASQRFHPLDERHGGVDRTRPAASGRQARPLVLEVPRRQRRLQPDAPTAVCRGCPHRAGGSGVLALAVPPDRVRGEGQRRRRHPGLPAAGVGGPRPPHPGGELDPLVAADEQRREPRAARLRRDPRAGRALARIRRRRPRPPPRRRPRTAPTTRPSSSPSPSATPDDADAEQLSATC